MKEATRFVMVTAAAAGLAYFFSRFTSYTQAQIAEQNIIDEAQGTDIASKMLTHNSQHELIDGMSNLVASRHGETACSDFITDQAARRKNQLDKQTKGIDGHTH